MTNLLLSKQATIARLSYGCCFECDHNLIDTDQCWKDVEVPAWGPNNIQQLPPELTCSEYIEREK